MLSTNSNMYYWKRSFYNKAGLKILLTHQNITKNQFVDFICFCLAFMLHLPHTLC